MYPSARQRLVLLASHGAVSVNEGHGPERVTDRVVLPCFVRELANPLRLGQRGTVAASGQ